MSFNFHCIKNQCITDTLYFYPPPNSAPKSYQNPSSSLGLWSTLEKIPGEIGGRSFTSRMHPMKTYMGLLQYRGTVLAMTMMSFFINSYRRENQYDNYRSIIKVIYVVFYLFPRCNRLSRASCSAREFYLLLWLALHIIFSRYYEQWYFFCLQSFLILLLIDIISYSG